MEQAVVDRYAGKFGILTSVCVQLIQQAGAEVLPKTDLRGASIWEKGATMGALAMFLRGLDGEEHKISDMVYDRLARTHPDGVEAMDYIEAALVVLDELGCHIMAEGDNKV